MKANEQPSGREFRFVTALVLLAAALSFCTPQGRQLGVSVISSLGASACIDDRYEISVVIDTENGGTFVWRSPISRSEYREAEINKRSFVERYGEEARKALARKMGYDSEIYGSDADKLANGRLARMTVTDHRVDRETELLSTM